MPQPWYGHGPTANAAPPSQAGPGTMQQHRFHHTGAPAPGNAMPVASTYPAHRSSPPIMRPPSSASTSSTASYMTASGSTQQAPPSTEGPPPKIYEQPKGFPAASARHSVSHPMPTHSGAPKGPPGGMHHGSAPRYPMPPRNGSGHVVRPMPRAQMPARQMHGVPPATHVGHPSQGGHSQGLLPVHNANGLHEQRAPHTVSSHYGNKPPMAAMVRPGHGPMHHPVPYRHSNYQVTNGQAPHGYHQEGHRSSYHHMAHHHIPTQQPHPEAKYNHFSRTLHESPETVMEHPPLSRSPTPPPPPPPSSMVHGDSIPHPQAQRAVVDRAPSEASAVNPLRERRNVQEVKASPSIVPPKPPISEDDDAASILLQLSGQAKKAEKVEATCDQENQPAPGPGNQLNKVYPTKTPANMIKPIEESSSIDEDTTVATSDGTDCAPDLTSEPSADSTDSGNADFPAPIPENYPTRLALPFDDTKLNSLHCFLRSELLEIFVVQKSTHKSPTHSPGSSVGRVGLRCVHCAMSRKKGGDRDEAPMAVFYPKSIAEIYRLVTSWQRCHLRKCRSLPPPVRAKWQTLRENDKSRGKTHYWITSAKQIGLLDCHSRAGGIRFGPNTKACLPKEQQTSEEAPIEVSGPATQERMTAMAPAVSSA